MFKRLTFAFILFISAFIRLALADTNVGGTISTSTTWTLANSPYIVTSNVIVAGASTPILTIEPGVVVKFNSARSLEIGNASNQGRLQAIGTATSPISFEANTATPTAGFWAGIIFQEKSGGCDSDLAYATIKYAVNGIYRINSGPCVSWVTFQNNTNGIRNNSWWANGIVNCSFIGNTSGVVNNGGLIYVTYNWWNSASGPSGSGPGTGQSVVGSNITYAPWLTVPPGDPMVGTNVAGTISTNTTWTLANSPYFVQDKIIVAGASTPVLTIEPGVTVKFHAGKSLEIGNATNEGRLQAFGTAAAPIIFEANTATPTAGFWAGIIFQEKSGGCYSDLVYATIKYAVNGIYRINSGPCVSWVTFQNNTNGIRNNSWWANGISHSSFTANGQGVQNDGGKIWAPYNWWNAASGPSGSGPGTGQYVNANVYYEPWLTAAPDAAHTFTSFSQTDRSFNPIQGIYTTLSFSTAVSADWTVRFYNSSSTLLRTFSGSGTTASIIWDGKNESNVIQPVGTYKYELQSTVAGGPSAVPAQGNLQIVSGSLGMSFLTVSQAFFSPNADTIQDTTRITSAVSGLFDGTTWTVGFRNSSGVTVHTATSTGTTLDYTWDGRNLSAELQPDGVYTVVVTAANDNASTTNTQNTVTLDVTFPVSIVTSPPQSDFWSNVYESGALDIPIIGTADDLNFSEWRVDYGAGANPGTWSNFAVGFTPKLNTTITSWYTGNINNGFYTVRLKVTDKAGNATFFPVNLTLGNFRAYQNAYQLNNSTTGSITYTSIIPFPLTQSLVIQNAQGNVVRTLLNNVPRAAGTFTNNWDGRGEGGVVLPDGVYYYVTTVTESGYTLVWDRRNNFVSAGYSCGLIQNVSFDPFNNVPLTWTATLSAPARVRVYFMNCAPYPTGPYCEQPNCSTLVTYVDELRQSGAFTVKYPAVDSFNVYKNNFYFGKYRIEYNQFPESATVLFGTTPVLTNVALIPSLYGPAVGNQSINFNLATHQSQSATVTVTYFNQTSLSILRTLTFTSVSPGSVLLSWDGLADNGMRVAPGIYTVTVTATDAIGNQGTQKLLSVIKY